MYLKKRTEANGDVYLSVMEKYYDRSRKTTRERTVEGLGHLSTLKKEYDDPIAHFTQYAKSLTKKKKEELSRTLTIDMSEKLEVESNDTRNVGYGILKVLYKELELDRFWNWKTRGKRTQFSTDQIFKLLTFFTCNESGFKEIYPG